MALTNAESCTAPCYQGKDCDYCTARGINPAGHPTDKSFCNPELSMFRPSVHIASFCAAGLEHLVKVVPYATSKPEASHMQQSP